MRPVSETPHHPAPMLYILGGLPGTGKTVLARAMARQRRALHLRIDTIEQVLRTDGRSFHGPEGYLVAQAVAADNLRLGLEVVADSVNPLQLTRDTWRAVAERCDVGWIEIEVICSDRAEHRRRVDSRASDVPGLRLPSWEEVASREFEAWDRPHIVVDTARKTPEESLEELRRIMQTLARDDSSIDSSREGSRYPVAASGHPRGCEFIGAGPVIPVPDVEAAVDYYCEQLGFDRDFVMGDPPNHGSVTRGTVGIQFTLSNATFKTTDYPGWFYFFVERIDSLASSYQERGIEFTQSLGTREHGMREFEIRDLNGFRLRFGQYI